MRKVFAAGLVGLALVVAACAPTKPPPPPPPPSPNVDVLMLGDSIGYGVGCLLGHNGGTGEQCPGANFPQPTFSTFNAYRGACALSQGWTLAHNQHAIEGPCNNSAPLVPDDIDYKSRWPTFVGAVDPELVVIVTGGWEIVDHWDETFPAVGSCALNATLTCAQADWQWGSTNPALEAGAVENYSSNLENAIGLIRNRPDPPKVLVLTMPYVDPDLTAFGPNTSWYESYDATKPADYVLPNTLTPYKSSKVKVDSFNATVEATVNGLGLPADVQWFDFGQEFPPGPDPNNMSLQTCPYPDNKLPLNECQMPAVTVRVPDRSHMSEAGNRILAQYLVPFVEQMLAP